MDIRDFILEDVAEEKEKETRKKAKAEFEYEEILSMPPDGIYRKKGKRSETILALIPTKGQFYIKAGNNDPEPVNADNLRKFFLHLDEPLSASIEWIDKFEKGKAFAESLSMFIAGNGEKIKLGIATFGSRQNNLADIYEYSPALTNFLVKTRRSIPNIPPIRINSWRTYQPCACGAFSDDDNYNDKLIYLIVMEKVFGLDATKNFVSALVDRDFNFSCTIRNICQLINDFYMSYGMDDVVSYNRYASGKEMNITVKENFVKNKNIPHIDINAFTEYVLSFQREGFENLDDFFTNLSDDWRMQTSLFGEIRERYPANLATHHNMIALRYKFVKDEIDKEKFQKMVEKMKAMEWNNDEYFVKSPKTVEDMVDEATQQCNCLRSYIGKVIEGHSFIYFLRKKSNPDDSLITIEVESGKVVQAKAKYNHTPKEKEYKAIKKWAADKGISVAV